MAVVRAQFRKAGSLRYISHLDLMRLLARALRRAHLPMVYSQGFHPLPRFSLAAALAVGITSSGEIGDFLLGEPVQPEEFCRRYNEALPAGVQFTKACLIPETAPSLGRSLAAASYVCGVLPPAETARPSAEDGAPPGGVSIRAEDLRLACERLLSAATWPVERPGKEGLRRLDIRPGIYGLQVSEADDPRVLRAVQEGGWPLPAWAVAMQIGAGEGHTVRPEEVLRALGLPAERAWIHREGLYGWCGRLVPLLEVTDCRPRNGG